MLRLRVCRFKMTFACRGFFETSRTSINSARASVITNTIHRDVVIDDRLVVDVNVRNVDVVDGAVIVKAVAAPISAFITRSKVAEAIIDAAVESDVRTPVPCVPNVHTSTPTPIAGRPQHTNLRRDDPRSWHPVVAI